MLGPLFLLIKTKTGNHKSSKEMVVHILIPRTWEFEDRLVYRASSGTSRITQEKPCLKNKNPTNLLLSVGTIHVWMHIAKVKEQFCRVGSLLPFQIMGACVEKCLYPLSYFNGPTVSSDDIFS